MARFVAVVVSSAFLLPSVLGAGDDCGDPNAANAHLAGLGITNASATEVVCEFGCWDQEDEACHQGLTKNQCSEIYGHVEWSEKCNCRSVPKVVCEFGCWDQEDEACHQGLTKNQCSEIYGHVAWAEKCNCRTVDGELLGNEDAAPREAGEANLYFSVPAFVVLFRESLEVAIVLVIIVQFLTKARDDGTISDSMFKRLRREVYVGAGVGFICCLILGVGFLAVASLARGLFKCDGLLWFDGVIMTITCLVLTFLALNFYKMIYTKEAHELKMKRRIDETIAAAQEGEQEEASFGKKRAFLIFAFSTGLREGLESIVFLVGVISDFKDPSYVSSLPIPMILALICSRLVACCFFQGTKKMRVDHFMRFCAILLLFIAAGFASQSMHKWQELDAFGPWSPASERAWHNQKVFDASDCCSDKTNRFFVLMRALFGWQDKPTPVEFFAWFLYWVVAGAIGFVMIRQAKRTIGAKLEKLRAQAGIQDEERRQQLEEAKAETGMPPPVVAKNSGEALTAVPSDFCQDGGADIGSGERVPAKEASV